MSKAIHKMIQPPSDPGVMIASTDMPLTVGDLRNAIAYLDDDVEIDFGSTLDGSRLNFYRFKWRGEMLLQMELNEDG